MSKGSRARPFSVTQDEYDKRWDAIFARDRDQDEVTTNEQPQPSDDESQTQESNE